MDPKQIIESQCDATRNILDRFGAETAMGYLIGEKFLNFLEVAETNDEWRKLIPDYVAEILAIFEPHQLAEYLETPRRLGALGHTANEEAHQMLRAELDDSEKAREDARNLLLLEWAKELLLDERRP